MIFYGVKRGDGRWLTPNYRGVGYVDDEAWSSAKADAWRDSDKAYAEVKTGHVVTNFGIHGLDASGFVTAKI